MEKSSEKLYRKMGDIDDKFIMEADETSKEENTYIINTLTKGNSIDLSKNKTYHIGIKIFGLVAAAIIIIFTVVSFTKGKDSFIYKTFNGMMNHKDNNYNSEPVNSIKPTKDVSKNVEPTINPNIEAISDIVDDVELQILESSYFIDLAADINWIIDLDGNGVNELVCYKINKNTSENTKKIEIYINNELQQESVLENPLDDFCIVDLDNSDNKYEIAVMESDISSNSTTLFYDWNGNNIKDITKSNGSSKYNGLANKTISFNVDNTSGVMTCIENIYSVIDLDVKVKYKYSYKQHTMDIYVDDVYNVNDYININYTRFQSEENKDYDISGCQEMLLNNLYVYSERDINSEKTLIEGPTRISLQKITLDFDNIDAFDHWIYIVDVETQTSGWIKIEFSQQAIDEQNNDCYTVNGELSYNYFMMSHSKRVYEIF